MLPAAYQLPAAVVLLAGGFIACFFGYRLFKVVLGVFGFIIGALAASSVFGAGDTTPMVIAAIVGGIAGAALLLAAYFVGVALVGAGIGALLVNVIWTQIEGDPHPAVVILFSVAGAVVATWLQRYVIILGTAFAGAWTMLVGGLALMGDQRSAARRRGRRRVGGVSAESGAGHAMGAVGVVRARRIRHAGADAMDRRRARARRES